MMMAALALAAADIPEAQLVTQTDGREVFAPAFRGRWASSVAECAPGSQGLIQITENHIYGYESGALLLKSMPMIYQSHQSNDWAYTVIVLTAQRAETELDFGKLRLSRLGNKLYIGNANAVPEEQHLTAQFATYGAHKSPSERGEHGGGYRG